MENTGTFKTIGRYQILEEIGRGGMGTVYKALQPSLNRVVAIKILPSALASERELLERFLRESQAIAGLSHPHIIQIIDRGEEKGTYYFVMEYMDGPSLESLLKKGPLPLAEALDIFAQVCQAVEFAHSQGVIHRDIKPSNVLLSRDRRIAKVADFGIARIHLPGQEDITLTQAHQGLGSLNYMAPEQRMDAGKIDRRADIYALGVVFYQMLTGSLPLGSFRLPSHFARRVPPQLDRVVLKCLRGNPAERYASVRELLEDSQVERLKAIYRQGEVRNLLSTIRLLVRSVPRKILKEKKRGYILGAAVAIALIGMLIWLLTRRPAQTYGTAPDEFSRAASALQKKFEYAESLVQNGMADQALTVLQEIVAKYDKSALADDAQIRIAQIKEAGGRYDEAREDYLKIVNSFSRGNRAPEAAFALAMLYRNKLEKELEAEAAFEALPQQYPSSRYAPKALFELAQMQRRKGETFIDKIFGGERKSSLQKAARTLETLIKEYPDGEEAPAALRELADLYGPDHLKEPQKSNQFLEILKEKYPQSSFPVLYYLGRNYEAMGQKRTARDYYLQFLKSNPSGEEARRARQKVEDLR